MPLSAQYENGQGQLEKEMDELQTSDGMNVLWGKDNGYRPLSNRSFVGGLRRSYEILHDTPREMSRSAMRRKCIISSVC
jgi:hypothetical protein